MESKEIKLCMLDEIPPHGKGINILLDDDVQIALFNIDGNLHAFENTCPHNHTHVLHEGTVDKNLMLTCPLHDWKFNLITGKNPKQKAKLEIFKVNVKENTVFINYSRKDRFSFRWD